MKWKGLQALKKEQVIVVFIIGLLLMVIALPVKKSGSRVNDEETAGLQEETIAADGSNETEQAYVDYLESRLEECLSQMSGAGKVQVFITLKASSERIIAKDRTASTTIEGTGEERETDTSEETVYQELSEGSAPYVVKEVSPAIKGVLVVAQGGDDPVVKQNISDAVMALFSIESHKIMVVRMKEG